MMSSVIYMGMVKCLRYVLKLVAKFKTGYEQLKDAACQGRPSTVTTNYNTAKINQILQIDARYTVMQMFLMTNLPLEPVHGILNNLTFRKKTLGGCLICFAMNKKESVLKMQRHYSNCIQNTPKSFLII